jgi:hypothetical protein
MAERSTSKIKELYDMIQEYSEYSTVAGILYIFMPQQTTAGVNFINMSSFCASRSQKCKNIPTT